MKREGIIIGGGAAGLMAAITAAENGASVTILEHMPRVGKKILSTGNGKCNMTNRRLDASCYRCGEPDFPLAVIDTFPVEETLRFFRSLGILTVERNGYVYPASGQAQTVLDALREKAEALRVRTVCECEILKIKAGQGFQVQTKAGVFAGDFLILAAGSMAAKSTGSDGSGYALAESLGHKIKKPLPALVQLRCRMDALKAAAGVRTEARVSLYEGAFSPAKGVSLADERRGGPDGKKKDSLADKRKGSPDGRFGKLLAADRGELQLTDYGISGIPVFQVSRYAAEALDKKKPVTAVIDFLPAYTFKETEALLGEQKALLKGRKAASFLNGIFNKKLAAVFLKNAGLSPEQPVDGLGERELSRLAAQIKEYVLAVTATNSYEQAQVCMGGVDVREICPRTMESRRQKGLYFAGEILDVDGICGGYNLQWAWSSGHLAGLSAAKARPRRE